MRAIYDSTLEASSASLCIREVFDGNAEAIEPEDLLYALTLNADCALISRDQAFMLRTWRAHGVATPIIVFAAGLTPHEEAQMLDAGADDVLSLSAYSDVNIARIKAVVRRSRGIATSTLAYGNTTIDVTTGETWVNGERVRFTNAERRIVSSLVCYLGQVRTKDALMDATALTPIDDREIKIIDVYVCKVRRKLRAAGSNLRITTVWGTGYRVDKYVAPEDVAE